MSNHVQHEHEHKSEHETARIKALHALQLLDTEPEMRFNRIVEYATRAFNVPIALITLVDEDRQWFKAKVGFNFSSGPRYSSICRHVVQAQDMIVIEDLTKDSRFVDNIYVNNAPFIRSYTGMPLILSNGYAVGALCVIDTKPRKLRKSDLLILRALGESAVREFERRSAQPCNS